MNIMYRGREYRYKLINYEIKQIMYLKVKIRD